MSHEIDHDRPVIAKPDLRLFDQVCERLRSAIVTGHFAPGSRLLEKELTGSPSEPVGSESPH